MKRKPPLLDKPYPRHRPVLEEEAQLWQETMAGKPRRKSSSQAPPRLPVNTPKNTAAPPAKPAKERIPGPGTVDARTRTKIIRGRMQVEAALDLHGHTRITGYAAVIAFIEKAQSRGVGLVLIITGKGSSTKAGILRGELPRWLGELPLRDRIIAYDAAGKDHGGHGAWYVRIRKRKTK